MSAPPALPPGPPGMRARDVVEWVWRPVEFLERNRRTYGPSFTVRALPSRPPIVWLGEPDAVRDLFAAGDDVVHAGAARGYSRAAVGDHSLLLLDGEEHRRRRRLVSPPFHGEGLLAHAEIMRDAAVRAAARWAERREVRLLDEAQGLATEVMVRAVFGAGDPARQAHLSGLLRSLMEAGSGSLLFGLGALLGSSRVSRLAGVARRASALGVPGTRLGRTLAGIDDWLRTEIAARRAALGGRARSDDVLSLLLAARDEAGAPLTDAQVRGELVTLLLAGHETTATTIAWAFHHLAASPAALARARAEIDGLPVGAERLEALARLPYLDAVVSETLRLTPAVPLVGRVVRREASFGPYRVPAGMMVAAATWLVHQREDVYPEPRRFRPERFLGWTPAPHEFFPFGGGARRCIGAAFATLGTKIAVAEVLARATLSPAGGEVRPVRRGILLAPSGGVRVRVRAR